MRWRKPALSSRPSLSQNVALSYRSGGSTADVGPEECQRSLWRLELNTALELVAVSCIDGIAKTIGLAIRRAERIVFIWT